MPILIRMWWISWLNEAFVLNPDITGMSNSGGSRFTTIDVKLANALNAMIASSGDSGKESSNGYQNHDFRHGQQESTRDHSWER